MKTVIRFILLIILIQLGSVIALETFQESKKAAYEQTEVYYVSDNQNGVLADPANLLTALKDSSATVVGMDDHKRVVMSRFSSLSIVDGRAPTEPDEYIAPADSQDDSTDSDGTKVGTYAETLSMNGVGNVYLMKGGEPLTLREIRFDGEPDASVADTVEHSGFTRLSDESIDRKINAEAYSLIELILKIFSTTLLTMGLVAWVSLVLRQVIDSTRQLETLAGFGASPWEIATSYVMIHRREYLTVAAQTGTVYLLAGIAATFITSHLWLPIFVATWLASFVVLIGSLVIMVLLRLHPRRSRGRRAPAWLFDVLVAAIGLGGYAYTRLILVLALAALLIGIRAIMRRELIVTSLYKSMGATLLSLVVIITVLTALNIGTISIGLNTMRKENLTVETTMPFETQIVTPELPEDIDHREDFIRYAYINPISGIEIGDQRTYPLVYATDLQRYSDKIASGPTLDEDSVVMGRALSAKYNVKVGDVATINGHTATVTNIVDTEQYAGMMIYLSPNKFRELYGDTGTTYFATDRPKAEVKNAFPDGTTIMSRSDYRTFYRNTVAETMAAVYALTLVILAVSAYIVFKLFSIFIDLIEWKVNLLRGLGLSKTEFMRSVLVQLGAIALGALLVNLVLSKHLSGHLTTWILNATDSYVTVSVDLPVVGSVILEYAILIVVLALLAYRRVTRESIYQQFLRTSPRT